MKALIYGGPGRIEARERPRPRPLSGQLLLRPLYVGVSFSDVHAYLGLIPTPSTKAGEETILGHEFSAVVEEIGEGLAGWSIGERVSVDPRVYCGQCTLCLAGLAALCERGGGWIGLGDGDGGMAEYCVVPASNCYKIPSSLSDLEAAMVVPFSCGTRAARLSGIQPGDNVAMLGGDDYSLSALQWAVRAGAGNVFFADPVAKRRAAAQRAGARWVLDPGREDVTAKAAEVMPAGADLCFLSMEEYLPASQMYMTQAVTVCRPQGRIVVTRIYGNSGWRKIPLVIPHFKEIAIHHYGAFFGVGLEGYVPASGLEVYSYAQ